MFDPLARLLPPPTLWDNPLFRTDARTIRFGSSWRLLRRRTFRWGIQMLVVLAICFGLALANEVLMLNPNSYSYGYWRNNFLGNFLAFAVLGSIGLNVILDFVAVSASLGTISSDFTENRADLIRLTLIRPTQIVAAKRELARVRVFRMTARIMWLRLWIVVMALAALAYLYFENMQNTAPVTPEVFIGTGLIILLTCATYIIEPYWRAQAITAAGVAVSARTRHGISATLNGGFTLIAFWIAQGLIIMVLLFLVQVTAFLYIPDPIIIIGMLFLFWTIITVVIYVFYAAVARNSLYQAAYRLATLDN
ncbi:MAG: hypothetical protein IAE80_17425 [Anaerolinea sp.]|nr:hypothetical protein [Anaerolinea sp.]